MDMERRDLAVRDLLDLFKQGMLRANPEYQRGIVWTLSQNKKLIDSIMRCYPLPLIYLHHIKKQVAGMQREDLEIIDGQQRINALHRFNEGNFKLFHPVDDEEEARFPEFLKRQPCPWGGKDFHGLSNDLQARFLDTKISVAYMVPQTDNEVRDLFVRLQAGLPLNAQETRDAWPGQFTDFILKLGGKPQVPRYPGHPFFQRVMGMKPSTDRGKTRQLCAQIAMLFFGRREKGPEFFSDINSPAIDDFYYTHIAFDASCPDASRFEAILDKLDVLLGTGRHTKVRAHDAIHLILLVDTLWDEYTRAWEATVSVALDQFASSLAKAKASKDSTLPDEFWLRYGQWTRVNSDRGDRIRHRHEFYLEKMFQFLGPLQMKDPKRSYGPLEREIIYFRDGKCCAVCKAPVLWNEAEVHHLRPHIKAGKTLLENGVLVHRHCHPKGNRLLEQIAVPTQTQTTQTQSVTTGNPVLLTELTYTFKNCKAIGQVTDKGFLLLTGSMIRKEQHDSTPANVVAIRKDAISNGLLRDEGDNYRLMRDHLFSSPSAAACFVSGNSRNGRDVWKDAQGRSLKQLEELRLG